MNDAPKKLFENFKDDLDVTRNEKICKSDSGAVSLWDGGTWYVVEFTQCDTCEKITRWVYHLSSKNWVTKEQIHLFIAHVFCRFPDLAPKN